MNKVFSCLKKKDRPYLAACNKKLNEFFYKVQKDFNYSFELKKDEKGNVILKSENLPPTFFARYKNLRNINIYINNDDPLTENILNNLGELKQLENVNIDSRLYCNYDIKFTKPMDSLHRLNLHISRFNSIEGLENMKNLEDLTLKANIVNIGDKLKIFPNLKKLHLKTYTTDVQIDTISNMKSLEELELSSISSGIKLTNLDFLKNLKNLKSIIFDSNKDLNDIKALEGMEHLEEVDLSYTGVKDLSVLKKNKGLKKLSLAFLGDIKDFNFLDDLKQLETLKIPNTKINAGVIEKISKCLDMKYLDISNNNIENISALAKLVNLEDFIIYENKIADISVVAGMKNLRQFAAHRNPITDITPLSGLINLEELRLSKTNIENVNPLSGLINLKELSLSGINRLNDVSPLANLTKLKRLDIYYTKANVEKLDSLEKQGTIIQKRNNN